MTHDSTSAPDSATDAVARFKAGVPAPLRGATEALLNEPVRTRRSLLSDLEAYSDRIDAAALHRRDLALNLARAIHQACRHLLEVDWPELGPDGRQLVQVACAYFVDARDGDGDLESVFGFDDDAQVLNAVLDAIDRPAQKVDL